MDSKVKYTTIQAHYKEAFSHERLSTNHTLPDKEQTSSLNMSRKVLSPGAEMNKEGCRSIANCIRRLNSTIESLTKENASLRKSLEETSTQKMQDSEIKKMQEKNMKLLTQVAEMKEKNNDLQEKYARVKEMYDIVAEKLKKKEEEEGWINGETDGIGEKQKKMMDLHRKQVIEIENLKSQIRILHQTVDDLEEHKKDLLNKNSKSGGLVKEISEINDQLMGYIKGNRKRKERTVKKSDVQNCSKTIEKEDDKESVRKKTVLKDSISKPRKSII
jgi:chromosome segregation ATPase